MGTKEQRISQFSRQLALFTDPIRLRLFFFLFSSRKNNLCVSDIASVMKSSLSNTSHQLAKLELAGIVEPTRRGRMRCYKVKKTRENKALFNYLTKLMEEMARGGSAGS